MGLGAELQEDIVTIQERIDRLWAELERQEAEDKAGTPGLWGINAWPQRGFDVRIGAKGTPRIASVPDRDVSINEQKANAAVICRARNLNPARLKEARRLTNLAAVALRVMGESEGVHEDIAHAEELLGLELAS